MAILTIYRIPGDDFMDSELIDRLFIVYKDDKELMSDRGHPTLHYHDAYEIMLLLEADNEMFVYDSHYFMQSGQIVFIPPYTVHRIYYKLGTRYRRYILNFEHDYLTPLLNAMEGAAIADDFKNRITTIYTLDMQGLTKISAQFMALLKAYEAYRKKKSDINEMQARLALASTMLSVYKFMTAGAAKDTTVSADKLIQNIVGYINRNYMNHITLEMIETEFSVSRSYISHKFKKITGVTFIEFLQCVRVAEAQKLLTQIDSSISWICYECGFNSLQHFYRVFKKVTGTTPGEHQKSNKAG